MTRYIEEGILEACYLSAINYCNVSGDAAQAVADALVDEFEQIVWSLLPDGVGFDMETGEPDEEVEDFDLKQAEIIMDDRLCLTELEYGEKYGETSEYTNTRWAVLDAGGRF